jgi:hypothetical protein
MKTGNTRPAYTQAQEAAAPAGDLPADPPIDGIGLEARKTSTRMNLAICVRWARLLLVRRANTFLDRQIKARYFVYTKLMQPHMSKFNL